MSKSPQGFKSPPKDVFDEWQYIFAERVAIMVGAGNPGDKQRSIAMNEADRHIEKLHPSLTCHNGWIKSDY